MPGQSHDGDTVAPPEDPKTSSTTLREKVYVGETSSQSFLHFLRNTVKAYIGSVPFTDGERQFVSLDVDLPLSADETILNKSQAHLQTLLESYFEATNGIMDVFTPSEIEVLLHERTKCYKDPLLSPTEDDDSAALDLVLAIGAQAHGLSGDIPLSKAYFSRARKVALENMFMCQTPKKIRCFLLLVFYMLGSCNRTGAAMFLGVAVKAAIMLGLHRSTKNSDIQSDHECIRWRIWNSIRNIDVLSSFILGRPKDSPLLRDDAEETLDHDHNTQSPFDAMLAVCSLLVDIVDSQRQSTGILHVPSAENQLQRLRQWSRALPYGLRQFKPTSNTNYLHGPDRQLLAGSMHISCVYYFAVILVTRPFLVAYLTSRLRGKAPHNLVRDPDQASDINIKNNKISRIGWVCVASAISMVEMCVKAKAANFTFGNLCLLKVWIFGAGLVLGFSMFAGEPRQDIDDAFNSACEIIADIAAMSPQAQLYRDILMGFASAVAEFHRRRDEEQRATVKHYMDEILVIDTAPSTRVPDTRDFHQECSWSDVNGTGASQCHTLNEDDADLRALLQITNGFENGDTENWNEVDMQLLHYPVPGIEPFDQFFYTVE
ncbi:hypothetical protein BJX99DRAFT_252862 [Aspergillus californicus]